MSQTIPLRVIQISDLHLFANPAQTLLGLATFQSLTAVLTTIRQQRIDSDLLLMTGDLSQDETPESYQYLRDLIAPLNLPTYWIPGNHDQPAIAASILETAAISPEKAVQIGNWQIILLSSQAFGKVHGELSPETLNFLTQQLQQFPQFPTLIALHHPPLDIGSDWMDRIKLQNPEALLACLDDHPQVKLVVFGHIHQGFQTSHNGVTYLGCPSTCVQFQPLAAEFTLDQMATPGFRVLTLYPDGTFDTQVGRTTYPLPPLP